MEKLVVISHCRCLSQSVRHAISVSAYISTLQYVALLFLLVMQETYDSLQDYYVVHRRHSRTRDGRSLVVRV